MKILSAKQIQTLDALTIKNEPISSIDLMERAALAFIQWFMLHFPDTEKTTVKIFCGTGNNGGDGLAIARLLHLKLYEVAVFCCQIGPNTSADFQINLKRFPRRSAIPVFTIAKDNAFPSIEPEAIIIDAIFGIGLNRPITGYWANLINFLNELPNKRIAVDIPSGLFPDRHSAAPVFKADYTLSFQLPKLAFFFPENQDSVGTCYVQPIGLSQIGMQQLETAFYFVEASLASSLLKIRKKFDHKGSFGHALLIGGSRGKVGAIVLAAKACLRSGAGLVSVHAPQCAYDVLQISFPEAMVSVDPDQYYYSENPLLDKYTAIGIGCGLDQQVASQKAIKELIQITTLPLVLDADGLNIISNERALLAQLPPNTILTPHPKEFERLFGSSNNDFERHQLQMTKAKELNIFIILKGANTCIACPDGNCYFNTTGNPGMATAGSGDVLTGIITGLLAQAYTPKDACILGVYLHGLAGDEAAILLEHESLTASDLIQHISNAFRKLRLGVSQK